MGKTTSIGWTHHTFNPWWGCQRVSPGCEHCYAEAFDRRVGRDDWGPRAPRRFFGDAHWNEPLNWDAEAGDAGQRRRVFCASMADVFEDREDLVEPRRRLWQLIRRCRNLDWLLLTKRPQNLHLLPWIAPWDCGGLVCKAAAVDDVVCPEDECDLDAGGARSGPWPNVWVGTTAENQEWYDRRWPLLQKAPAVVRFISVEPMLGHIFLRAGEARPDWIIIGGESGGRAFDVDAGYSLLEQARGFGVPVFFKQLGTRPVEHVGGQLVELTVRDRRRSKNDQLEELPQRFRVREFPEARR